MKVRYIGPDGDDPSLTSNSIYFVVGVEFSSNFQEPSQYIQFRVLNDDLQVTLCKAKNFEIIKSEIASNWQFVNRKKNDYSILPKQISNNSFWEEYYDGNKLAIEALNEVYTELVGKYSLKHELQEMINSQDMDKSINAIRALRFQPSNLFDEVVVNRVKSEIHALANYSNPKVNQLILEGYEYLSHKSSDIVEELFLSYYEHIELHCEKLEGIVNRYFSEKLRNRP